MTRFILACVAVVLALSPWSQIAADGPVAAAKPKGAAKAIKPMKPALSVPPGFRTVETAIPGKIRATQTASSDGDVSKIAYLGASVVSTKGRLVVEDVAVDSPAEKGGLKAGDVVVEVNALKPATAAEFRDAVQSRSAGDSLGIVVLRQNKSHKLTAILGTTSRPVTLASDPTGGRRTGRGTTGGRPGTTRRRAQLGLNLQPSTEPKGMKITAALAGMAAAKAGLKAGDVILKVDGGDVAELRDIAGKLSGKQPGDAITVVLLRKAGETSEQTTVKVVLEAEVENPAGFAGRRGAGGLDFNRRRYWTQSTYRLAIVGVEYPDVKHNKNVTTKDWEESFFSRKTFTRVNATGQLVFGSMNDYYHELSVGKFQIKGKVFDWVTLSKKRAEYTSGTGTSRNEKQAYFREVLEKLADREGDDVLDNYDGVVFLYAGGRFRTTRGGLYWPHRSTVSFGRRRLPYFICPEGGNRMQDISVFCHEFGHMLGLPDLYARPENPGSEGASVWCAMSNQAANGRPQHFSAWCKERLGWLKPTVIDPRVKQKLILSPVENSRRECFKVLIREDGSEYFLLENRRKTGFDRSLPAEGLLIWRVVGGRPFLEESHGETGPQGPYVFRDLVPFPSKANTAFTPYTTPSSSSKLGGGLPVHITNIRRLADGRITFYVGYEFN